MKKERESRNIFEKIWGTTKIVATRKEAWFDRFDTMGETFQLEDLSKAKFG